MSLSRSSPPAPALSTVALSDREFDRVRDLIAREVGIQLGDGKRALVLARLLPRLRALGLRSFTQYIDHVVDGAHPDEHRMFIDCMCTNETSFFRELWQFEYLEQIIVPHWKAEQKAGRRDQSVRIWSAACSTGDEPYSIAMLLGYHLPVSEGWQVEVLATDISTRVLRQAEAAVWNLDRSKTVPPAYLKAFMLRGEGERAGTMKASSELRSMIRFEQLNLQSSPYPASLFDLVFCRNVLIYFDAAARLSIIERLIAHMEPDGHLFVGHAETIAGRTAELRTVVPSVYTLKARQADVRPSVR